MGNDKKSSVAGMVYRLSGVVGAAILVTACSGAIPKQEGASSAPRVSSKLCDGVPSDVGQRNPVTVQVYFVQVNESLKCPTDVDQWAPIVEKSPPQRVRWVAVEYTGNPDDPESCQAITDVNYGVIFDPFVGHSPKDPPVGGPEKGIVWSKPVHTGGGATDETPANVLFKYTIDADGCAPLDPFIRIQ